MEFFIIRSQVIQNPHKLTMLYQQLFADMHKAVEAMNVFVSGAVNHWGWRCYLNPIEPLSYILKYRDDKTGEEKEEFIWIETISTDGFTDEKPGHFRVENGDML